MSAGLQTCYLARIVLSMTSEITTEIAARLEAARVGQGLSFEEVAGHTGLSVRMVKAKLAGERELTSGDLSRFAGALGTKPSIICEGF